MGRKRELAKNTAILTFGKICTQCISFFMLPLYTALLDTSDYGAFDLLMTYATLLIPLVNWQFDQGLFRFVLDVRQEQKKLRELFSGVFFANTIQMLAYIIVTGLIVRFTNVSHAPFLCIYVILQVYVALLMQFARGLGKSKVYAVASFISASATVILNVVTLAGLRLGIEGLFISCLCAQGMTLIYLCAAVRPWNYFSFQTIQRGTIRAVGKYSVPLIPNNLAWWVVEVSDRAIISYILGLAVNGVYTVANKFSGVFIQFYNIFNLSWTETVSLHYEDEDRDVFLSEMVTTMFRLFSSACFGIVALMPFVFPLMIHERYAHAYPQIIILMYAMLFRVIVGLYSCVYVARKDSKKIAATSFASAVINICVHMLLIYKIGLYAASISTLVAFAAMAVIRYIDINRHMNMKIATSALISTVVVAILLMVSYYINHWMLNTAMLLLVCIYALVENWGLVKTVFRMVRRR